MHAVPGTAAQRAGFLTDFARRLHLAGVSAARLEGAVKSTAAAIGEECEIWSSPTGILLSAGKVDASRYALTAHQSAM